MCKKEIKVGDDVKIRDNRLWFGTVRAIEGDHAFVCWTLYNNETRKDYTAHRLSMLEHVPKTAKYKWWHVYLQVGREIATLRVWKYGSGSNEFTTEADLRKFIANSISLKDANILELKLVEREFVVE